MKNLTLILTGLLALAFIGCAPSASQLKKVVEENPDIVYAAIQKDPAKFIEVVNQAARTAQKTAQERAQVEEKAKRDEEFKNPRKPVIGKNRAVFGNKSAPITIVEYSDFECPYCSRAHDTIKQVMKEYKGKVRIVYKHLPLDFHPKALPAAKIFEAIAIQDTRKAQKWHDQIFEQQRKLKGDGEAWMKSVAKKLGVNMKKLAKDINGAEVKKRIDEDIAEARKFGFSGTPGFLINGVSLKGAYPFPEFKKIIDRHLKKGG